MFRDKRNLLKVYDEEGLDDPIEGNHGDEGNHQKSLQIMMDDNNNNREWSMKDPDQEEAVEKNRQG